MQEKFYIINANESQLCQSGTGLFIGWRFGFVLGFVCGLFCFLGGGGGRRLI